MIPPKYWSPTKKLMVLGAMAGGKTVEATALGNPLTFTTDKAKPLKSLLIPFTPKQSGTGNPSPENVRPIVPWDGLKVWQSGKNILTGNFQNGVLALESGGTSYNPNYIVSDFIPVKPLTSYYFRCPTVVSSELDIVYYDKDKHYIGYTDADGYSSCNTPGRSRKTPAGCYYVRIDARNAQYNNDICINYPASVTGYVPAVGITETDISFPSPVYGGTLDVVSGVLKVTHVCLEVSKQHFTISGNGAMPYMQTAQAYTIQHKPKSRVDWVKARQTQKMDCAVIANPYSETTFGNYIGVCFYDTNLPTAVRISKDLYDSLQDGDSVSVCYEIEDPFDVQLTTTQLTAIVGDNTIWSDADGQMTAVYLKKG